MSKKKTKGSRDAYLFFSVTGLLIAAFLFFMFIFNIINDPFFKRLPWNQIVSFHFYRGVEQMYDEIRLIYVNKKVKHKNNFFPKKMSFKKIDYFENI